MASETLKFFDLNNKFCFIMHLHLIKDSSVLLLIKFDILNLRLISFANIINLYQRAISEQQSVRH